MDETASDSELIRRYGPCPVCSGPQFARLTTNADGSMHLGMDCRWGNLHAGRDMWKAEAKRLAQALDDWGYGDYDRAPHQLDADGVCQRCGENEYSCPYRDV